MLTVVTGPPCSGKSTYVRAHAVPGDIVIDFDAIAQAFGSPVPHDHHAQVRHVTIAARRAAIEAALTVCHRVDVWIVDCNISPERMAGYKRAGATFVGLVVDAGELHRRADTERPPLWHGLIDRWTPAVGLELEVSSRQW
jgi:hypothetical protein